ncbi:MAG: hypothetical protein FWC89_03795 [Defluviitaleaceae bacterium]|nr:hypothetical protein [Defluviitaleaceae bacterium]
MLNNLNVNDKQFGTKIGKHAQDYGLDPKNAEHREVMRQIINDIVDNYDEIRVGTFLGQTGNVDFYVKGQDVVIANNGRFVSILKDGVNNLHVMQAIRR